MEALALQFLTVLCFLQLVMGRSYMIENPKGSDIYEESAIHNLQHECLPHTRATFDQCPFGATMDGGFIQKSTDIESDQPLPELCRYCDRSHQHVHLRGSNKMGTRTAQAAVYPDGLCDAILQSVHRISTKQSGGRICIQTTQLQGKDMIQSVSSILSELQLHAQRQGRTAAWDLIVTPWLCQHPQLQETK